MVRAQDAPVETAKFMGHGVCDHITKTTTLNEPTDDLHVIERTVFAIKNALNVHPQELRGIGIQISKLDDVSIDAPSKSNALKKMFERVTEKNQKKPLAIAVPNIDEGETTVIRNHNLRSCRQIIPAATVAKRGRKDTARSGTKNMSIMLVQMKDHSGDPIEDQLDMNVLAELPEDIRAEVLHDQKLRNAQSKREMIKKKKPTIDHINGVDSEFLAALPFDIRTEITREQAKQQLVKVVSTEVEATVSSSSKDTDLNIVLPKPPPPVPPVSESNVFVKPNWRAILQAWLDSTINEPPLECDVDIFADYAVEMIRANLINELYLCFRFFYR